MRAKTLEFPLTGTQAFTLERSSTRRFAWPLAITAVAAGWIVHWRALFAFFSADDLMHLQQAAGLLPTPTQPWRFLTQVAYFRAMLELFGPRPLMFMGANLLLHSANVLLFQRLLRKRQTAPQVALLAAVVFAASPLLFVVIAHAAVVNDFAALTFMLLALLAAQSPNRAIRVSAVALTITALFCKESVLFLPLLAFAKTSDAPPARGRRTRRVMLVVVVTFCAVYLAARAHGAGPGGPAYATSAWIAPWNLLTYTTWVSGLQRALIDIARSPHTLILLAGGVTLGGLIIAARVFRRHAHDIAFGLAWWLLGLLPVLPLRSSRYPHYLYVALPGFTLAASASAMATWDAIARRVPPLRRRGVSMGRARWTLALGLSVAYVLLSRSLVSKQLALRMHGIDLPLDPQIRSSVVAGRAVMSLAHYDMRHSMRLAIISPPELKRVFGARSGREYSSPTAVYDLQGSVLNGGRALRVFYPELDSVVYVDRWSRALAGFEVATYDDVHGFEVLGRSPAALGPLADRLDALGANTTAASLRDSMRAVARIAPSQQ